MAQLASLLTIAFIIYALWQDSRQAPRFSLGTWISFLWIVKSVSRPILYWIQPNLFVAFSGSLAWRQGNIETVQNNPVDRSILLVLMVLGLVALAGRRHQFEFKLSDNGWLVAFFAICFISSLWSIFPGDVLKRSVRLAGDLIPLLLILTEGDAEGQFYRIMRRMAILFLPLSILMVKFHSQLGRVFSLYGQQMWVGLTDNKNTLGAVCAFTGIVLVWRNLKKWPKISIIDLGLLAMVIYLLIGAQSSTSDIIFLLGVLLLVAQSRVRDARKFIRAIIIGLVSLFLIETMANLFLNQSLAPAFFSAAGRDSTFTGRVPLWQELIRMGLRSPILGQGFTSFWTNPDLLGELWGKFNSAPTIAHNGYLEVFLDLGVVGLLFLLLFLAQTYRNIMFSFAEKPNFGRLKIVLFAMVLLANFTESNFGKANTLIWLLFLMSSIVIVTEPNTGDLRSPSGLV